MKKTLYITQETQDRLAKLGGPTPSENLRRAVALAECADELAEALKAVLDRDQRNTCLHEETHRGGHIWEICDQCGMKWSDDRDPKPEWVDPSEWDQAGTALTNYRSAKQ